MDFSHLYYIPRSFFNGRHPSDILNQVYDIPYVAVEMLANANEHRHGDFLITAKFCHRVGGKINGFSQIYLTHFVINKHLPKLVITQLSSHKDSFFSFRSKTYRSILYFSTIVRNCQYIVANFHFS